MASIPSTIEIKSQYRPCIVKGKKALFHKWGEVREIVAPSLMKGGHGGGVVAAVVGIVEYENGSVAEVPPCWVQFVDNEICEYAFCRNEE